MEQVLILDGLEIPVNAGISYRGIEVGELKTRTASFTNRFKIPDSVEIRTLLGQSHLIHSVSGVPYTKIKASLVIGGIQVMSGYALIQEVNNGFALEVYDGLIDFPDVINGKKLEQITTADIDATAHKFPQINYGSSFSNNPATTIYDRYLSFPYKEVIQRIFTQNGFTVSGAIFSETKLSKTYIAAVGWNGYKSGFTEPKRLEAKVVGNSFSVPPFATIKKFAFANVTKASSFYNGTDRYQVGYPEGTTNTNPYFWVNVYVELNISVSGFSGADNVITLEHKDSSETVLDSHEITSVGNASNQVFRLELTGSTLGINLKYGDSIEVLFRNIGTGNVTVNSGMISIIPMSKISTFKNAQYLFPDVLQSDLIKDFYIRHGLIPRAVGSTIYLKTLNEIIADKTNCQDWSTKRVSGYERFLFKYGNYGQTNRFKYSEGDEPRTKENLGLGSFAIDNESLPLEKDIYVSPIRSTQTRLMGNSTDGFVTCGWIPSSDEPESGGVGTNLDPKLRLILIRDKDSNEVGQSEVGYFEDPTRTYTMSMDQFIKDNYSLFVDSIKQAKVVEREYVLDPIDFYRLNPHSLVWDDAYFIVISTSAYAPGITTKVQMLRVQSEPLISNDAAIVETANAQDSVNGQSGSDVSESASATHTQDATYTDNHWTVNLQVRSEASFTGAVKIYYRINGGSWVLFSNPSAAAFGGSSTYIDLGSIALPRTQQIEWAIRNDANTSNLQFGNGNGGTYTGYCGQSTPYASTPTANETRYLNLAITSNAPVTC